METNKKIPLLFLLLALPHVCTICEKGCPQFLDKNLICYNDYNCTIHCVWNSTYLYDHADAVCTIHAERRHRTNGYSSSCILEPVDASRPTLKQCSVVFETEFIFQSFHELTINLTCNPVRQNLTICHKPVCQIKLNPPPKPNINFTTVSWFPQVTKQRISNFRSHLQWKPEDMSWSDPSVREKDKECDWDCTAELEIDELIKDKRYEARVRVQSVPASVYLSTWSDWSPTASWVSLIGEAKPTPPPPSDFAGGVLGIVVCAVFALFLILLRTDKTNWIYIVKRIRGPPLPDPRNSFLQDVNFQNWLSPHFASGIKPIDIASVEVTSSLDAVTPNRPDAALLEKMRSESGYESTSSSFSNPSYSQLSPPLPVSLLTAGNLEPCGADTPYGPVGSQGEGKNAEQDRDEVREKEVAILQLLSKGSNNDEPMLVISDYEKVERPRLERFRLQSLDSGVCSGEEVSQESLEADSINVTDSHDEGPEGKEEREGGNAKEDFQKLLRGGGGIFNKGSIQVCSDYERVQNLQADSPELPSLDSGMSSGEEQVSQEESLEDTDKSTESTSLLFPPSLPPSSTLACSLPSFTPQPLNFSGAGLSLALRPLPSHILERIALMSTVRSVEPSGDGYMPARQEQS